MFVFKKSRRIHLINGGNNGLSERKKYLAELKKVPVFICDKNNTQSSSGDWHDPVDNPISTNFYQNGNFDDTSKIWGLFGNDIRKEVSRKHTGIDLFAKIGTPVYACLPGKVVSLSPGNGYGNGYGNGFVLKVDPAYLQSFKNQRRNYDLYYIKSKRSYNSNEYDITGYGDFTEYEGIKNSEEVYLMYAHLSEVFVTLNQKITLEDYKTKILGKTGNTGASGTKGPHLHFEIRSKLNPSGYSQRFYVDYKNKEQLSVSERKIQDLTAK